MNTREFKFGDRVFDIRYGWGTVIDVNYSRDYPICVSFDELETHTYTRDGKFDMTNTNPILSHTKYSTQSECPKQQLNEDDTLCAGLNQSANIIFQNNKDKGFWDNERNVGELLMLVVSELGEAMEAHRKGRFANGDSMVSSYDTWKEWFEKHYKDSFEDEICDAVIRLLDLSAGLGIDLEKHINEKVKYNKLRERLHGKKY